MQTNSDSCESKNDGLIFGGINFTAKDHQTVENCDHKKMTREKGRVTTVKTQNSDFNGIFTKGNATRMFSRLLRITSLLESEMIVIKHK